MLARSLQAAAAAGTLLISLATATADESADAAANAFVDRVWTITSMVLKKHIEPPTRQEMLLGAARGLWTSLAPANAQPSPPHELSRQFSEASSEAELRQLLADAWHKTRALTTDAEVREGYAMAGLLRAVPGPSHLVSNKEFAVQQQLSENRYVGIGIELRMDEDKRPVINKAFPRAPLHRAGGRDKDRILAVDGQKTDQLPLNRVIDLLRGPEGSSVQVEVRAPDGDESRVLDIVRGVVPLETIRGRRTIEDQQDYRIDEKLTIGYVRFQSIGPSTLLELRTAAQRMQSQKLKALVLDLREMGPGSVHHAAIIADALLDKCRIGSVQTVSGTREYESQPDHLFSGWKLAVLVDRTTLNEAEWLAAALQDNGRAAIVGEQTPGDAYVIETFPLPGELGAITLRAGILKRPKGELLNRQPGIALSMERLRSGPLPVFAGGVRPDHPLLRTPDVQSAVTSGAVTLSQPLDLYIAAAVKVLTGGQTPTAQPADEVQ